MRISPLKNTKTLIICYTILFAILTLGIFLAFILQGRSFVNIFDAFDQGYFWTVELKQNLASMFSGDGFPEWSWSKGTGMDVKPVTDPFMIFAALFPAGHIELGYTLAIVLRMYCAGLAFIAFGKEAGFDNFQCLLSSVCYVFSTWLIDVALVQGQFVNIAILFPLLILSVDRIYKGKSPVLFMVVVACTMCSSIYLAYMAGICTVIYILLRFFRYHDFSIGEYIKSVLKFIGFGIAGIAASVAVTMVTITSLMGASTGESGGTAGYDLFKGASYFFDLGNVFISEGFSFSYEYLGIPVFALLVIAVSFRKFSVKNTYTVMTAILAVMMVMPFFSSMFNGFGYVTSRWFFLLLFFVIWTAAESFRLDELADKRNIIIMGVWWCVMVLWTLGFAFLDLSGNYSIRAIVFVAGNLMAGLLMTAVVATGIGGKTSLRFRQTAIVCLTAFTLIAGWNVSFYDNTDRYCDDGEINSLLSRSTQRAGSMIDDDGFYRIDQVDGINIHQNADQPANENLWWQTKTLYLYDSKIPENLQKFNRLTGNNYSYSKRVYVLSNGNRMGLDFLYGVKYFLGDDHNNEIVGSGEYAGYGFEFEEALDGVDVYRNKYDSGLGFEYDRYISESEFEKLSRLEREQALLQAVVIPDEECEGLPGGQEMKAADIDTDIDDIPWEFVSLDGLEIDGNTINVYEDDASLCIAATGVTDSQMVVSFDNLKRVNSKGKDLGDFCISCTDERLTSWANNKKNNQTIPGIADFDMNMGYYDSFDGNIRITFSREGTYTFDRLYVSGMSADNYDTYASRRLESKFNIDAYDSDEVTGSVNAAEDGFMFFSIPMDGNWEAYIDGAHVDKIDNANIAFFAVPVDKGTHEVALKHSVKHRTAGIAVSLLGILAMVVIEIIRRKMMGRRRGDS